MLIAEPRTRLNVDEFTAWLTHNNREGYFYELHDGEIVEVSPSGFYSSEIASRLLIGIGTFVYAHQLGYVTGEQGGYRMSGKTVFAPDVGFISNTRLTQRTRQFAPVPPDLAVEVLSPSDDKRALQTKAEDYLHFGTRLVWLVLPDEQAVEVYAQNQPVQMIGMDGMLDGGDVLPDFQLSVREIFPI